MRITVATMDRAIWAARLGVGLDCYDPALRDRAIYLRGLADAAKVLCLWDGCSSRSLRDAIRETAKRLRKEIKP
jgi:hypothetical protein